MVDEEHDGAGGWLRLERFLAEAGAEAADTGAAQPGLMAQVGSKDDSIRRLQMALHPSAWRSR